MRTGSVVIATLLLAGCAGLPVAPPATVPADDSPAMRARAEALGLASGDCALPTWGLRGRVALSNGRDGGSGTLDWSQGGGRLHLDLSAPVTRLGWRLDVEPQGATLHGAATAPLQGPDAAALLRETTGLEVPVAALGCWLRAVPADPARFGPAQVAVADAGLPQRIEQSGWRIVFEAWKPAAGGLPPLPARLTASRGEDRVRLVIDLWRSE